MKLILSCEHATAWVPEEYAGLFAGAPHILETHRGYDIGALEVCRSLEELAEAAFYGGCSRLLIDLNRSRRHPRLFSCFVAPLSPAAKERIIADWYAPFRTAVLQAVEAALARQGEIVHLSLHSFTPVLNGVARSNDIGILYDPGRRREKELARRLAGAMHTIQPQLKIRMNQPYQGTSDGHTSRLRKHLDPDGYRGIELEINQRLLADQRGRVELGGLVFAGVRRTIVEAKG